MKKSLEIGINVDKNSIRSVTSQIKQGVAAANKQASGGPGGPASAKQQAKNASASAKQAKQQQQNIKQANVLLKAQLQITNQITKASAAANATFNRIKGSIQATQQRISGMFQKIASMGGSALRAGAWGAGRGLDRGVSALGRGAGAVGGAIGGGIGRAASFGGNLLVGGIGALFGAGISTLTQGYQQANAVDINRARIAHLLRRGNYTPGGLNRQLMSGVPYGYNAQESIGQMAALSRNTGGTGLLSLSQAASRGTGIGVEEFAGFAGTLTRAGSSMKDEKGRRTLSRILTDSVRSGLDDSRTGEHLDAVSSMVQSAASVSGGEVNVNQISGLLANLGSKLGAGFQGERGARVIGAFDQALKSGGGGDAAKALSLQAMGFGTPEGGTSYYQAIKAMQQGVLGTTGAENFVKILKTFEQRGGGEEEVNLGLSNYTGLSIEQIEKLRSVYKGQDIESLRNELQSMVSPEDTERDMLKNAVETFLKGVREEARLDNRMVASGEGLLDGVREFTKAINGLVDVILPDLTKAINAMIKILIPVIEDLKNFLKEAIDWIRGVINPESRQETMEQTVDAIDDSLSASIYDITGGVLGSPATVSSDPNSPANLIQAALGEMAVDLQNLNRSNASVSDIDESEYIRYARAKQAEDEANAALSSLPEDSRTRTAGDIAFLHNSIATLTAKMDQWITAQGANAAAINHRVNELGRALPVAATRNTPANTSVSGTSPR